MNNRRIPILVVPEGEVDFGGKSFDEPKILRCETCGNAMFYLAQRYGLVNRKDVFPFAVLGETEESKKYRDWDIDYCSEERYCAVCKRPNGMIPVHYGEEIAHEFEDCSWEMERYEKALDLLKYPGSAKQGDMIKYDKEIEDIKEWISELEERNKKKRDITTKNE